MFTEDFVLKKEEKKNLKSGSWWWPGPLGVLGIFGNSIAS
jgi:hypothetical protein